MEGTQENKVNDLAPLTTDVPQTIIVTGATGSMGAVATRTLAAQGKHVILACRNIAKAENLRQEILHQQPDARLSVMHLDLSCTASIRAFAERLQGETIHALFCNAGVKAHKYTLNAEGIEMNFATNYLGNRLLCLLLLPLMPPRANIVLMVSLTTRFARLDLNWRERGARQFGQLSTYGSSKLALLYFAIALARRHPELRINVSDPGVVNSDMISMGRWYDPLADLFFRPFIKTPQQGVHSALQALQSHHTLKYFVGNKEKDIPQRFLQSPLVDQLWEQAEKE